MIALVACSIAFATAPALAHDDPMDTAREHAAEDLIAHEVAHERQMQRRTARATAADAARAAESSTDDPGEVGEWGPVVDWPVVGVHAALLPDGRVLAYDSVGDRPAEAFTGHGQTRATVWDPATGLQAPVNVTTGVNVFCSGLAHLVDGSVFLAGGNRNAALDGIAATHVFDPSSSSWSREEEMEFDRWYPSVTPLSDGEMLITGGRSDTPEIRATDGSLRTLEGAQADLPLYPWLDVGPDGRAFVTGPDPTMGAIDAGGDGDWDVLGRRDSLTRDYGSRAMFDVGRILIAGGGPSSPSARVIDLNGPSPTVAATEPMATGRRQHNLTVLADGSVLATGGNSSGAEHVDLDHGVYAAELWDPNRGSWRTLAPMRTTRQYHSTSLLLPDGRVLSSGGGICKTCEQVGYLAKSAEVFSPPYLFAKDGSGALAERPEITGAPAEVGYREEFELTTADPDAISKVALVRLGAVTHSVDMEQRYVPLEFRAEAEALTATSPPSPGAAPPGVYMLFVVGAEGVPSVARMIWMSPDPTAPAPPPVGLVPLHDHIPPDTRISKGPGKRVAPGRVKFEFSADEAEATFECRLNSRTPRRCTSPRNIQVGKGSYRFSVRAIDPAGNVDPRPAVWRFRAITKPGRGE